VLKLPVRKCRCKVKVTASLVLSVWVALGPLAVNAGAQQYMFNRADFPTAASFPQAIATGDFNGDGLPDLALATGGGDTVSILLGKPGGGFAASMDYAAGANPVAVVAGDFNGDGKLDLAVVDANGDNVSILLGNGDGTFHGRLVYGVGSLPEGITTGDFNGDGKLDLAVANYSDNTISVLLGNGDGTFQVQQTYPVGLEPTSIASGDLNGDGKLDLAVSVKNCPIGPCSPGFVSVLLGKGDGTFAAHVDYTADIGPASVAIGDFNGDGKPDLAVGSLVGTVSILLNNGDGTFQPHVDYAVNQVAVGLAVSDFNGDGKLDLAVNNGGGVVSILLGQGNGTFQAHVDYGVAANPQNSGTSVIAGDFNGDGKVDLAVADSNGASILLGNGNGAFGSVANYTTGNSPISAVAADFNGDGKPDLAVVNSSDNTVSILLNNGDGTFKNQVTYATSAQPGAIAVGDFNGDGKLDLAVTAGNGFGGNTGFVSILLGNGDGTFQPHADVAIGTSLGSLALAVGDFNGDGKPDLAVGNSGHATGILSVLLGNGDGTFQSPINTSTGNGAIAVAVGDFNGDGKLDAAVADGFATVAVLLGKGDGTFQGPVHYPTGDATSVAVADLTGNGKLDLVVGSAPFAYVSAILLGNGDGTFRLAGDANGNVNVPADLNGDGKIDLFGATSSGFVIALGNGDGTFQSPIIVGSPGIGQAIAADFRGDGVLGLAGTMATLAPVLGTSVEVLLDTPVIALSPRALSFQAALGTSSAPQTVALTNPGVEPLSITNISSSGDYSETNTCGAKLAAGASCTISVTFSPLASGTLNGAITIVDGAPTSPQVIALTGTGINGPFASASPSSLTFGNQLVGTASTAATVALTNTGNASLAISSIGVTGVDAGDFAETNTCNGSLAAAASCKIFVTFKPTQAGLRTAALAVTDNGAGSPQKVPLTGNGTAPGVSLSPASLGFGSQLVSAATAAQSVTLTNNGDAPLAISNIAASGDFAVATSGTSCSTSTPVAVGANCTIAVTFTPVAGGNRTGTLSISDNAPGSPQTAALAGTGEDFSIGAASGSSTSATVTAGQTATYSLAIAPTGGLTGTVSLVCTGAPTAATCSVSPASVALNGAIAANPTVTVTTMGHSMTAPRPQGGPPALPRYKGLPLALWLMALATLIALITPRRRRAWAGLAVILTAVVLWAACGGGGGNTGGGGGNSGTPAGTYSLTVTGTVTSGSTTLKNSMTLNLTVN
jgi:VCBS repeat protein/ASPM-SPD-2-Hydin domain-containing protein